MHEGLANVCLITSNMTIVRAKIDVNIPRKRKGNAAQHDKDIFKANQCLCTARDVTRKNFSID
uniref:ERF1 domain-containing protein n=1 Tax=Romanomermis culicivorax TaxID=13658 RepID=A0A915HTE1_ROMCU